MPSSPDGTCAQNWSMRAVVHERASVYLFTRHGSMWCHLGNTNPRNTAAAAVPFQPYWPSCSAAGGRAAAAGPLKPRRSICTQVPGSVRAPREQRLRTTVSGSRADVQALLHPDQNPVMGIAAVGESASPEPVPYPTPLTSRDGEGPPDPLVHALARWQSDERSPRLEWRARLALVQPPVHRVAWLLLRRSVAGRCRGVGPWIVAIRRRGRPRARELPVLVAPCT